MITSSELALYSLSAMTFAVAVLVLVFAYKLCRIDL